MSRVGIQVHQVLGSVFSHSQLVHRCSHPGILTFRLLSLLLFLGLAFIISIAVAIAFEEFLLILLCRACFSFIFVILIHRFPVVDGLLIHVGVVAIPAVPLAFIVQVDLVNRLILHDVLPCVLRQHLSRPLHAVLLLVSHGTAVLTSTLAELGYHLAAVLLPSPVPCVN